MTVCIRLLQEMGLDEPERYFQTVYSCQVALFDNRSIDALSGRSGFDAHLQKSSGLRIRGAIRGCGRATPRDGGDVLNRMNVVELANRNTRCPDEAGLNVICLN